MRNIVLILFLLFAQIAYAEEDYNFLNEDHVVFDVDGRPVKIPVSQP